MCPLEYEQGCTFHIYTINKIALKCCRLNFSGTFEMKKENYCSLHAGGSLVMGQEQDGKAIFQYGNISYYFFDKQQSFSGQLTQVELWNTTLSASDIQKLAACEVSSLRPQNRVITWKSNTGRATRRITIKDVPLETLCEKNLVINQFIWPRAIDFNKFNSLCMTIDGTIYLPYFHFIQIIFDSITFLYN